MEVPETLNIIQASVTDVGYMSELDGKSVYVRTRHALVVGCVEIRLQLILK